MLTCPGDQRVSKLPVACKNAVDTCHDKRTSMLTCLAEPNGNNCSRRGFQHLAQTLESGVQAAALGLHHLLPTATGLEFAASQDLAPFCMTTILVCPLC